MRILKATLLLSILPLLNGCITYSTLDAAKAPATRPVPDKVYHVEKAVISKDQQMVIYLEGCLTNSSQRSQFTVSVSLDKLRTGSPINFLSGTNPETYMDLRLARSVIHSGWTPQESSMDNFEIVPVGSPVPTPSEVWGDFYNEDAFARYAELLPNTTQTLYPVVENRNVHRTDWPTKLEFIYLDASSKQAYTIIHVDEFTVPSNRNKAYYGLVPVTVPLDVATAPFQLAWFLLIGWAMAHSHGC